MSLSVPLGVSVAVSVPLRVYASGTSFDQNLIRKNKGILQTLAVASLHDVHINNTNPSSLNETYLPTFLPS
jgi:hypothetical protein